MTVACIIVSDVAFELLFCKQKLILHTCVLLNVSHSPKKRHCQRDSTSWCLLCQENKMALLERRYIRYDQGWYLVRAAVLYCGNLINRNRLGHPSLLTGLQAFWSQQLLASIFRRGFCEILKAQYCFYKSIICL